MVPIPGISSKCSWRAPKNRRRRTKSPRDKNSCKFLQTVRRSKNSARCRNLPATERRPHLDTEKIMSDTRENSGLTRRGVLMLSAGVAVANFSRLHAFSSDFWNKKEPSQWSSEEIEQLTAKSPWAKETTAQYSQQGNGGGLGGGPGGGGGGGMGGGRGGRGGGQRSESIKGTVRWESAKPILDAMKTALPEDFANRYVISVSGFPLNSGRRRRSQDDSDTNSSQSTDDMLDNLKALTYLE